MYIKYHVDKRQNLPGLAGQERTYKCENKADRNMKIKQINTLPHAK
jgi:hypothetical protein